MMGDTVLPRLEKDAGRKATAESYTSTRCETLEPNTYLVEPF